MPDAVLDELLEAWKQGEQLLPSLPPLSSDHETVRLAVAELRAAYVTLVDREHLATALVETSEPTIQRATHAIREVSDRTPRRP
jgi:hypothetical protein